MSDMVTASYVGEGHHGCPLPIVCGLGEVWRCPQCGRTWTADFVRTGGVLWTAPDCTRPHDRPGVTAEPVVEHALRYSGGSMMVRPDGPEIELIYPLADWIAGERRMGARVYRRTVIVVEDWQEVTDA